MQQQQPQQQRTRAHNSPQVCVEYGAVLCALRVQRALYMYMYMYIAININHIAAATTSGAKKLVRHDENK